MKPILFYFILIIMSDNVFAGELNLFTADADYGEYLSGECKACHHKEGLNSGIPAINDLEINTFVNIMRAYKAKEIESQVMQMIAGSLDENQILSLAIYFNKLKSEK